MVCGRSPCLEVEQFLSILDVDCIIPNPNPNSALLVKLRLPFVFVVYFVVYFDVCSTIPHFPSPPILLCLTVDEKENVVREYCGVNPNPSVLNVVATAASHVFTDISWFVDFVVVSLLILDSSLHWRRCCQFDFHPIYDIVYNIIPLWLK